MNRIENTNLFLIKISFFFYSKSDKLKQEFLSL